VVVTVLTVEYSPWGAAYGDGVAGGFVPYDVRPEIVVRSMHCLRDLKRLVHQSELQPKILAAVRRVTIM
jgi:hypothetical protein